MLYLLWPDEKAAIVIKMTEWISFFISFLHRQKRKYLSKFAYHTSRIIFVVVKCTQSTKLFGFFLCGKLPKLSKKIMRGRNHMNVISPSLYKKLNEQRGKGMCHREEMIMFTGVYPCVFPRTMYCLVIHCVMVCGVIEHTRIARWCWHHARDGYMRCIAVRSKQKGAN